VEKVSRIETSLIHFDTSARFVPYLSTFILGVYLERTQLQPACLAEAMAAARTHFYLPSISCSGAQRAGAAQRGAGRGAEEARGPEAIPLQPHTGARRSCAKHRHRDRGSLRCRDGQSRRCQVPSILAATTLALGPTRSSRAQASRVAHLPPRRLSC
jgi:hypothetical protein